MHTIEEINSNPIFQPPAEMLEYFEFFEIDCDELDFPNLIKEHPTATIINQHLDYINDRRSVIAKHRYILVEVNGYTMTVSDFYTKKINAVVKWFRLGKYKKLSKQKLVDYVNGMGYTEGWVKRRTKQTLWHDCLNLLKTDKLKDYLG